MGAEDGANEMVQLVGLLHGLVDHMVVLVETAQAYRARILAAGFSEATADRAAGEFLITIQNRALEAIETE